MISVAFQHHLGQLPFDVRFEAPAGVTALFGPSGAGKSTTLKVIAGLESPKTGMVTIAGKTLLDTERGVNLRPEARGLGVVFQEPRLFSHMSVRRNLLFGAGFRKGGTLGLDEVAGLLGISALLDRDCPSLSGGEAQRVAIGRALLSAPHALILDEPLASLDQSRKSEILPYLARLRDHLAMPMLLVTHDLNDVAQLADYMVLMDTGRTIASGPVTDILADPVVAPRLGIAQMGAVITGQLNAHFDDGLSQLNCAGGTLLVPLTDDPLGTRYKLRVLAKDITISLSQPKDVSALNTWPAIVRAIRRGDGPGALVTLECGGDMLLARLTKRSLDGLELREGQACWAMLKTMSMAPAQIGA